MQKKKKVFKYSEQKNHITNLSGSNDSFDTSNIRSSIWEKYKLAAIILANKHTSRVTSGVTLGFPAVHIKQMLRYRSNKIILRHDFRVSVERYATEIII